MARQQRMKDPGKALQELHKGRKAQARENAKKRAASMQKRGRNVPCISSSATNRTAQWQAVSRQLEQYRGEH